MCQTTVQVPVLANVVIHDVLAGYPYSDKQEHGSKSVHEKYEIL